MNKMLHYITESLHGSIPEEELRETALWVAEETTGLSRTEILCKDTMNIPNLEIILQRIRQGEPLQYIFGYTEWGGLRLKVNKATLIPRPETYDIITIFRTIYNRKSDCKKNLRVLDACTGSGCIAIALKKKFPQLHVSACDISYKALQVVQENAVIHQTDIYIFQCDILQDILEEYDIIVSNPPDI